MALGEMKNYEYLPPGVSGSKITRKIAAEYI